MRLEKVCCTSGSNLHGLGVRQTHSLMVVEVLTWKCSTEAQHITNSIFLKERTLAKRLRNVTLFYFLSECDLTSLNLTHLAHYSFPYRQCVPKASVLYCNLILTDFIKLPNVVTVVMCDIPADTVSIVLPVICCAVIVA